MNGFFALLIGFLAIATTGYAAPGDTTIISPARAFGKFSSAGNGSIFATTNRDTLKVVGSGGLTVSTNPTTKTITLTNAAIGDVPGFPNYSTSIRAEIDRKVNRSGDTMTGNLTAPVFNATTGYTLNGAAASGNYLRGNGTNFISSAIQAADVPTLNQNTTGSAATLTTPRAIYGNNFNGSADLTQVIASTYGGTGNGFTKFTGPTTAEKTFTLPDSSQTLLYSGGALGTPSSGTATNLTGTAAGLTAGNVTTNANLTGPITSVGNATSIASQTGTGSKIVVDTSPTIITSVLSGDTTLKSTSTSSPGRLLLENSNGDTSLLLWSGYTAGTNQPALIYTSILRWGTANAGSMTATGWVENGRIDTNGSLNLVRVGAGLLVKEGTNATMGVATLAAGTVTVSTTKVTANSRIFLTPQSLGTITRPAAVGVTARTAATSFVITSGDATDTSTIAWIILEPS